MRGKPLILRKLDNGCIVPISHKLNKDGYFRYTIPNNDGKGRGVKVMYHRYVWENEHGSIPRDYEIDHICKNRACCNIEHLQMLKGTEHTIKDNKLRYKARKDEAKNYWMRTKCTGSYLASLFCVSFSTACKWIREWKV
jgi:hypothetical protein